MGGGERERHERNAFQQLSSRWPDGGEGRKEEGGREGGRRGKSSSKTVVKQ